MSLVNWSNQTGMAELELPKLKVIVILKLISQPIVVTLTSHQIVSSADKSNVHSLDAAKVIFRRSVLAICLLICFCRLKVKFSESSIV